MPLGQWVCLHDFHATNGWPEINTMVFALKHHGVRDETPRCLRRNTAVFNDEHRGV